MTGSIVGVYRAANALHVRGLLAPALARGWTTAWWALDEVEPGLEQHTVGHGPGEKLPLLNAALERLGRTGGALVLADDDIVFRRGDVVRLAELAERAGLGLAQPAHARGSRRSHPITDAAPLSRARLTTFVESGPLVVVSPAWRERVLPLPERRGMGWGIELDWMDLRDDGCRLGIVDACRIRHVGRVGAAYDMEPLARALRAEMAERGFSEWYEVERTLATWRPWRAAPPWLAGSPGPPGPPGYGSRP